MKAKVFTTKQTGSALLIAMLIMAGVVTISIGTSKLVLNEIKQSTDLDQAITAFYASESGLEQSLYFVRKANLSTEDLNNRSLTLSNDSSSSIITKDGQSTVFFTTIEQDQTVQLDLFKPDSLEPLDQPIRSVKFNWTGPANSVLEVSWVRWDGDNQKFTPTQVTYNWTEAGSYLNFPPSQDTNLYRLRLTSRFVDLNSLTVTAYNQTDPEVSCPDLSACRVDIPGLVTIKSVGQFPIDSPSASKQAVSVTIPTIDQLSSLFNFVLYSEQDITKDIINTTQ